MNLVTTTTVSSLPFDNNKQRQIKVVIHCGPKVASTTLRVACRNNIQQTCPQLNLTSISHEPPGYTGGNRLVSIMKECVDTYYFCVNQITVLDMLSTTTTLTTTDESTATNETNIQYIHLFPFRNYNDWVKSAIKQQYDRSGQKGCRAAQRKWEDGKCQHLKLLEPDIRKYGRVDLERFLGGVVRLNSDNNSSSNVDDEKLEEGSGGEEHTFLLYPHTDLHEVMKVVSTTYHIPMLPGTTIYQKGERPEGTCNESLVELYHECFSDELMEFQWDLPENQVHK